MDTDLLKTFLEVSHTRHFGKAAENLYLTRSAVSFRVKQLESILGVELFERQRNNIQPTPAGERMLVHAEAVLLAWERAKQDVSLSQVQSVQLAIGAAPNIWDAYLQDYLQGLHVGLSGVALRTEVQNQSTMTRQLMERTLDIAISFDPPKLEEFELLQIGEIVLGLVSCEPVMSLADTLQQQYIKVDWGTAFNIQHARDFAELPLPVLHTGSARIALDFLLNNGGCAFLPQKMVQSYLDKGQLYLVPHTSTISRSVYVSYLTSNDRLPQILQAVNYLKTQA
ncbi:HTH-type transcriptional regulator HdfR [Shewanella yunxiaonensis]|uniref:HTH-type transcriptional regulator HdfR n=1 Tax=Shewanella yunxiaonensis TaxID=2829809 RepID=A0ABX7YPF2_9GAMM|nr:MULTISPECIES: HTH-type transcriptional regulator HdfR [Shewanella]MDF0533641.1 HTH-type transcriptional regulator HdfR [Shewanella sp. A32]QUN04617.1 HTH-type transcriptional regulator HdfR [Shewanella yunxiaonensis]